MIYVTLGEPYSINIEVIRKLQPLLSQAPCPLVLVGSLWQWQWQGRTLGFPDWDIPRWESSSAMKAGVYFWNIDEKESVWQQDPAKLSRQERGQLAKRALDVLQQLNLFSKTAFITGPIDKFNCQVAGFSHPGQTEYFEELAASKGIMILAGPKLRVGLVTNHLALRDVSKAISTSLVEEKIEKLAASLRQIYQVKHPKIAVVGLNPHCGDGGVFGNEDQDLIRPAVENMRRLGWDAIGPVPADTAFFQAYHGRYDAVLAMYHDQGLGPLKTVHFYDAVNITGGLKFLRVSPDHGPASDLYGKGQANIESFRSAIAHAFRYISHDQA